MSSTRWATTLQCDYPGCQSVATVSSDDEVPAGWLHYARGGMMVEVRDIFGRVLSDFCSIHADMPLRKLAGALAAQANPA